MMSKLELIPAQVATPPPKGYKSTNSSSAFILIYNVRAVPLQVELRVRKMNYLERAFLPGNLQVEAVDHRQNSRTYGNLQGNLSLTINSRATTTWTNLLVLVTFQPSHPSRHSARNTQR